jgi:hypothetical protein
MSFINVRSNLAAFAKEMSYLGSRAIFASAGKALRDAVMEDFELLVQETPQWSGDTAASWRIGMPAVESGVSQGADDWDWRDQNPIHVKGDSEAVAEAMAANERSVPDDFRKWAQKDLTITNDAPGFETSESGKGLRPENTPGGMLARFETRFSGRIIDVNLDRI